MDLPITRRSWVLVMSGNQLWLILVRRAYSDSELGPLLSASLRETTSRESMGQILDLLRLYMARKDIDYVNKVIELASDLALRNKGIQPLLGYMLEIRNTKLAGPNFLWLAKEYASISITELKPMEANIG